MIPSHDRPAVLSHRGALHALHDAGIEARWLREPALVEGRAVSIDSREVRPGQMFIALRGERTDGHLYLHDAARAGAWAAMVERADVELPAGEGQIDMGVLWVPDARAALVALARAHRARLAAAGAKVIGLTGSVGKTTTTRLIHAVLSASLRGTCPRKSFNNALGVPMTLLSAGTEDDYVVCEIGTSAPGEIAALSDIARPDCGVVIAVGHAHLEKLGSLEGVAEEKSSLLRHVQRGGLRIARADAPFLLARARRIAEDGRAPLITYALDGSGTKPDHTISHVRTDESGVEFTLSGFGDLRAGVVGAHNACNAAVAALVGRWAGLNDDAIRAALAVARGAEMRMELRECGHVRVIDDAYNANPDSMLAGLRTLVDLSRGAGTPRRAVAILGDMGELGPESDAMHRQVLAAALSEPTIAQIIVIGPRMAAASDRLRRAVDDAGDARWIVLGAADDAGVREAAAHTRPGDLVLVKASRSTGLDRVVRAILTMHQPTDGQAPAPRGDAALTQPAHAAR